MGEKHSEETESQPAHKKNVKATLVRWLADCLHGSCVA
jgi:hypothetical protein